MSNLHDAIWKQSGIRANSCCGSYSYAVPWSTVQRICKRSDCTYPWLQHARMEILDVQACDCHHEPQKPCLVVSFDCYFPRLPEERASSTEYGCVKNWLSSNGQNVSCRLCSQCTGYEFNGEQLTTDGIADMLTKQTRWDRWWYLSTCYEMDLSPTASSRLEYSLVYTNESGHEFPFEPGHTTKSVEDHWKAGTHFAQQKTKRKFLEPAQFHAAFWIFSFLHELLVELYVSLGFTGNKFAKVKRWAKQRAMKLQPDEQTDAPHEVLQSLSPMFQRVERLDDFICSMEKHLTQQVQRAGSGLHVFGFQHLRSDQVDVKKLVVKLAHVVAELLPQTCCMKVSRDRMLSTA